MCMLEDSTIWLSTRGLLVTLALGMLWAPSPSLAQSVAKMPRIGILTRVFDPHAPSSLYEVFRQGLRDLGYVEGQSIALEYRSAEGQDERFSALAAELVRLKVDIILAESAPAVRAAQHATGTIPIVFPAVFDPVSQGLVASLWVATALTPRALQETETAAHALGVQLQPLEVRAPYPFDQAFATMVAA